MSHFTFLQSEWPDVYTAATQAEALAHPDPRTSCFYARRTLELAVTWLYQHDANLERPYQDHLAALLAEPTFRRTVGEALSTKLRIIKDLGNDAVHSRKPIRPLDSVNVLRELFHFCYWLARTYARTPAGKPPAIAQFSAGNLPQSSPLPPKTIAQLEQFAAQLAERDRKLVELSAHNAALDEELVRIREEVAAAKRENEKVPDSHDYSEAETRDYFIDLLLREAGWTLDQPRDREFPVTGMPSGSGQGFVDYVLWGDDGKPLAVVEAKRTKKDLTIGRQQAKLYSDCLEAQFGQRPIIFLTNGYQHAIWDDVNYAPRPVQGFRKKDELALLIQRRTTLRTLATLEIDPTIVERHYQLRAIRRIAEAFEQKKARRALVVMATGAGKTRTVIALCDLLMRANWVKRVLFLADRVALVNQAVRAFKSHLPGSSPVNLVSEKDTDGRVYVSTYPTMLGLINDRPNGESRFSPGHFDLIVIDEAHRSVYQRYKDIFNYFDSLLVGLTATPRDEVSRDTYSLFQLERNVPTDLYEIADAVKDGYLVRPEAVSVPLRFPRDGISFDDLPPEEQEEWEATEWTEDGQIPDRVEAPAVNDWLFNLDTVDKMLEHLMRRGLKVAGGDRLGKTIIFANNQKHANFIAQRFDANYPHYKGAFARVITFETKYAQSLIDDFSNAEKSPHIAISVDMLDTGIDVPEVVNLVFFKLVRSKTKFWQMVGRGTRLRPDLFGPGDHKKFFYIFDYCGNLEYFRANPAATDAPLSPSLNARIFSSRVDLITELDHLPDQPAEAELRDEVAEILRTEVESMDVNNFIVRPHRLLVEKYAQRDAWKEINHERQEELQSTLAGLPSSQSDLETDIDAKQFDLLMLNLQLARLRIEARFAGLSEQVRKLAGLLAEKDAIPMVRAQMPLIQEVMTDAFWQDVTAPILENVRRKLRALIKFIEKGERKTVYTNFTDVIGDETLIALPGFGDPSLDFERFRAKARDFLRQHESHPSIGKLRQNVPLTAHDLAELERLLLQAGIGSAADLAHAKETSEGLGLFVRSLIGLDREAAKRAFGEFLEGNKASANQIEFINMVIDQLTQTGIMEPDLLYTSPFIDINPRGVEGVFPSNEVDRLIHILNDIRAHAAA
jgi:type I restriction enzyme R subunit